MKIYFNGQYCNIDEAKVSILDRGYIFGDGIYEVFLVKNGKFIEFDSHMERFARSLSVMNMKLPQFDEISSISKKLLELNGRDHALMYIQVTRGSFETREHDCPETSKPTLTIIPYLQRPYKQEWLENGITCMLAEDIRWKRRDIKSINLLGCIMLKQKAMDCGFNDVIFYDNRPQDGGLIVSEASSSNLIMVKDGVLKSHPNNQYLLGGIAKERVFKIAKSLDIKVIEKEFTCDELMKADGVILTNSGYKVRFVTSIDGKPIGNGKPCKISKLLYDEMEKFVLGQ